ncbi:olfactory receptor 52K1-like [Protopterus annectens]|uniref:olfactory receptor 52K1-like n=1 Tax=Protopterus annectens TaxID=7888 RepID=UPI001CFC1E6F|nr:olfactory receptor 52K1-like [Protopterus annectens]
MVTKLSSNQTSNQDFVFILTGLPGLHNVQHWLSFPFIIIFLVALLGNVAVPLIIIIDKCLHEPMYYFISILSVVDLIACLSVLPSVLLTLVFGSLSVLPDACFLQMFCVPFIGVMQSAVLVLMAYDRYIAVCKPLRYSTIVTNTFIVKAFLLFTIRSICAVLPIPVLANLLPYCGERSVQNIHCEYLSVINVACARTTISDNFHYIIFPLVGLPDATLIGLSYYRIVRVTLQLKSKEALQKTFSTCSSHISVFALVYLSVLLSTVLSLSENHMPPYMPPLSSVIYLLIPPTLNPLVYGAKSKQIKKTVLKHFRNIKSTLTDKQRTHF